MLRLGLPSFVLEACQRCGFTGSSGFVRFHLVEHTSATPNDLAVSTLVLIANCLESIPFFLWTNGGLFAAEGHVNATQLLG